MNRERHLLSSVPAMLGWCLGMASTLAGAGAGVLPPPAQRVALEPLTDQPGKCRMVATYPEHDLAKLGDLVTYPYMTPHLALNDRGVDGDLIKGDGVYSAIVSVPSAKLNALEKQAASLANHASPPEVLSSSRFSMQEKPVQTLREEPVEALPRAVVSPLNAFPVTPRAVTDYSSIPDPVFAARSLMITDISVLNDLERNFDVSLPNSKPGVWSFKHLIDCLLSANVDSDGRQMGALTPETSVTGFQLVRDWLNQFAQEAVINGQAVPARPEARVFLEQWVQVNPEENLDRAPFRLMGIFLRTDLAGGQTPMIKGNCGEVRFVYGLVDPVTGSPLQFAVIFEYAIHTDDMATGLQKWCQAWIDLNAHPLASEDYRKALQALTERVVRPSPVAGDASLPIRSWLSQVRTNEDHFKRSQGWVMREWIFRRDAQGRPALLPDTVKQTPRFTLKNSQSLRAFLVSNKAALERTPPTHTVPAEWNGAPFLAGFAPFNGMDIQNGVPMAFFTVPDVVDAGVNLGRARLNFSVNTCNSCHAMAETGTLFTHVGHQGKREITESTALSPLLRSHKEAPQSSPEDPARAIPAGEMPIFQEQTLRRQKLEILAGGPLRQVFFTPTLSVH